MARTILDLPTSVHRRIGAYLSPADLTRLVRASKSFARLYSWRLYEQIFPKGAELDPRLIVHLRSEFARDYVASIADELIAKSDCTWNTLLRPIGDADNELCLGIFIKRGVNASRKSMGGWSLLHHSLEKGYDKVVNKLLDAGADVLTPAAGWYPTPGLPSRGISQATIDRLMVAFKQAGGDISATGSRGLRTALHYACIKGQHRTVKALLDHGADVLVQNSDGQMPLLFTVRFNHLSCTKILLEAMHRDPRGYDINAPIPLILNTWGRMASDSEAMQRARGTILHLAVAKGEPTIVQLLLKYGADPDADDQPDGSHAGGAADEAETPFSLAVEYMNPYLINLFLGRAYTPRKDSPGLGVGVRAMLGLQTFMGSVPLLRSPTQQMLPGPLLSNPNPVSVDISRTIPHVFTMCREYDIAPSALIVNDCIRPLVEEGMPVNRQDDSGTTFLHHLSAWSYDSDVKNKVELIGFLLDHGADWTRHAQGLQEDTVLHRLARVVSLDAGFDGIIRRIAREGCGSPGIAAVNEDGDTALHLYLSFTDPPAPDCAETVKLLVQAGCGLNVLNKKGRAVAHSENSPLISVEWVDLLEDLGMDLSLCDSEGRPPLHYAICRQSIDEKNKGEANGFRHQPKAVVTHLITRGAAQHAGCAACEAFVAKLGRAWN
ncbi:ankyrin repeat-containing domain protein [Aspergillus carlsbadensis]|nr:ankyrin repeat-containing domain protein [Aspergillus carlsbadensis]